MHVYPRHMSEFQVWTTNELGRDSMAYKRMDIWTDWWYVNRLAVSYGPRLFIPCHTIVVAHYGITLVIPLSVCLSVHPVVVCLSARPYFHFQIINMSKCQWIFTKLDMCIDIVEIWFGIANLQSSLFLDKVVCLQHDNGWVLLFHIFFSRKCGYNDVMAAQPVGIIKATLCS